MAELPPRKLSSSSQRIGATRRSSGQRWSLRRGSHGGSQLDEDEPDEYSEALLALRRGLKQVLDPAFLGALSQEELQETAKLIAEATADFHTFILADLQRPREEREEQEEEEEAGDMAIRAAAGGSLGGNNEG